MDRDALINRLVDGRASADEWARFERLSETDSALWRDLIQAQRDQAGLVGAVESLIAVADAVDLPMRSEVMVGHRLRMIGSWGGWAAAATIALAWATGAPIFRGTDSDTTQAGFTGSVSPVDMLGEYIRRGQKNGTVVGEVPQKVLLRSAPLADGQGFAVLFERRIVERAVVGDMHVFQYSRDETGRPVPIPVTVRSSSGPF